MDFPTKVGGVSAPATVEEAVTAAAEEVDNWWGGWRLCSVVVIITISYMDT
jgi:hypothetical protein